MRAHQERLALIEDPKVPASIAAETEQARCEASRPLGALLLEADLIGKNDLERALAFQEQYGGRLGSILVRLGALSEERLLPVLAAQLNLAVLGESELPPDPRQHLEAIERSGYPLDWWVDQEALPWFADDELWIAAKDPLMPDLQEF